MLFGWLIANVLTFLGVLTAAYAFVPGGKIMRERTGFMLVVQLALLGLGLVNARQVDLKRLSTRATRHRRRTTRMQRRMRSERVLDLDQRTTSAC